MTIEPNPAADTNGRWRAYTPDEAADCWEELALELRYWAQHPCHEDRTGYIDRVLRLAEAADRQTSGTPAEATELVQHGWDGPPDWLAGQKHTPCDIARLRVLTAASLAQSAEEGTPGLPAACEPVPADLLTAARLHMMAAIGPDAGHTLTASKTTPHAAPLTVIGTAGPVARCAACGAVIEDPADPGLPCWDCAVIAGRRIVGASAGVCRTCGRDWGADGWYPPDQAPYADGGPPQEEARLLDRPRRAGDRRSGGGKARLLRR